MQLSFSAEQQQAAQQQQWSSTGREVLGVERALAALLQQHEWRQHLRRSRLKAVCDNQGTIQKIKKNTVNTLRALSVAPAQRTQRLSMRQGGGGGRAPAQQPPPHDRVLPVPPRSLSVPNSHFFPSPSPSLRLQCTLFRSQAKFAERTCSSNIPVHRQILSPFRPHAQTLCPSGTRLQPASTSLAGTCSAGRGQAQGWVARLHTRGMGVHGASSAAPAVTKGGVAKPAVQVRHAARLSAALAGSTCERSLTPFPPPPARSPAPYLNGFHCPSRAWQQASAPSSTAAASSLLDRPGERRMPKNHRRGGGTLTTDGVGGACGHIMASSSPVAAASGGGDPRRHPACARSTFVPHHQQHSPPALLSAAQCTCAQA